MDIRVGEFEGPLDLLLHLIAEHKIDILDLPIAEITGQYLQVIRSWQAFDMDIASEFVLMAARLLEIKSRMMLPKPRIQKEEEDPRAELAAQLLQYSAVRRIAVWLMAQEEQTVCSYTKDPDYLPDLESGTIPEFGLEDLADAIRRLTEQEKKPDRRTEHIVLEEFTVDEKKDLLRKHLQFSQTVLFNSLFPEGHARNPEEVAVTLLAVLEMFKTGEIDFLQEGLHCDIRISKREDGFSDSERDQDHRSA